MGISDRRTRLDHPSRLLTSTLKNGGASGCIDRAYSTDPRPGQAHEKKTGETVRMMKGVPPPMFIKLLRIPENPELHLDFLTSTFQKISKNVTINLRKSSGCIQSQKGIKSAPDKGGTLICNGQTCDTIIRKIHRINSDGIYPVNPNFVGINTTSLVPEGVPPMSESDTTRPVLPIRERSPGHQRDDHPVPPG